MRIPGLVFDMRKLRRSGREGAGMKSHDLSADEPRHPPRDTDFVQSLARGLAVTNAFDATHPQLTLSEVARAADIPPAAARRFLLTLVQLGYVSRDGDRYRLRPRVLDLGYRYLSRLTVREVAESHLEELAAEVNASASLSILDGVDIVVVCRVATSKMVATHVAVGSRLPVHLTAMGRVLLAGLPPETRERYLSQVHLTRRTRKTICDVDELRAEVDRVRRQGWSIVDGELEEGLRAVAVPVRSRTGVTVAALNVSTQAGRTTADGVRHSLLPPLLATAARVEAELQIYPPGSEGPAVR